MKIQITHASKSALFQLFSGSFVPIQQFVGNTVVQLEDGLYEVREVWKGSHHNWGQHFEVSGGSIRQWWAQSMLDYVTTTSAWKDFPQDFLRIKVLK